MIVQARAFEPHIIAAHRGWFLALGIAQLILGIAAVLFPVFGTFVGARVFGWIMLFSGIATAAHSFRASGWGGVLLQVLIAIAYIAGGIWLLANPLASVAALTLVLIVVLLLQGIFSSIEAFQIRGTEGWGWMLVSGVASIVLALMIKMNLPSSAFWSIGLLLGISLAINGWSFIALAFGARES